MDWLVGVVNSPNFGKILIVIILLLIGIAHWVNKGKLSINAKGIKVGGQEQERNIIRRQIEYVYAELDIFFQDIIKAHKNLEGFDERRCLYSKELVLDIFMKAISLNHITKDEFYIKGKEIQIWAELAKLNLSDYFNTQEFRELTLEEIKKITISLVDIRNYYSKN